MNRITQSLFLILILASPAFCQEPDSVIVAGEPDSVIVNSEPDSLIITTEPEPGYFLSEPDSIYKDYMKKRRLADSLAYEENRRLANSLAYEENRRLADSLAYEENLRLADSLAYEESKFSHSSKKALMYALVLPGLGQAYNKKYFKIPIVAAALGGVGYAIVSNTNQYRESIANYVALPNEETKYYLDAWRRYVEVSYIGLIVVYALQVLDAYVDAQLYSWDVNENLSLRIAPSLQPMMAPVGKTGQVYGLSCSFDFKRR